MLTKLELSVEPCDMSLLSFKKDPPLTTHFVLVVLVAGVLVNSHTFPIRSQIPFTLFPKGFKQTEEVEAPPQPEPEALRSIMLQRSQLASGISPQG